MKMKQVYVSYNGCCCVPGPVNKLAIFGSRKNRTNCVTDHTKGLKSATYYDNDKFFFEDATI